VARNSTDISAEDSVEFRRCWALGEIYYFLKTYNDKIKEDMKNEKTKSKAIKFYRNLLVSLSSICKELGFEDENIENFLENLERENPNDKLKPNFEGDLESYIIGHLNGIDPRYSHIFRLSKHTQRLYELGKIYIDFQKLKDDLYGLSGNLKNLEKLHEVNRDLMTLDGDLKSFEVDLDKEFNRTYGKLKDLYIDLESSKLDSDKISEINIYLEKLGSCLKPDKEFNKISTDLDHLKNFISSDKISLIQQTIQNWQIVSTNWEDFKTREYEYVPAGSYYHFVKTAKFLGVINKIRGLITGSVEIYDILNGHDIIVYYFVIYAPVVIILFFISYLLVSDLFKPLLNQLTVPTKATELTALITAVATFLGGVVATIKAILPLWKRGSEVYKLRLAINRLKNPEAEIIKIPWK
jgi:hypothetical protein